ncbi:MAG: adenylosuccinate lyase, partial [Chloroflexota bacterium]
GARITAEDIHAFVDGLDNLSAEDKARLQALTPATYIGIASELIDRIAD